MIRDKDELRNQMWDLLETSGLSVNGKSSHGKIPDFKGSARAAELLSHTIEWANSNIIFCSPDTTQKMVRELALKDQKDLIMPSPKLKNGYLFIKASEVYGNEDIASTIKGAFKYGKKIEMFSVVDLVVEGSVAVDMNGNRLGKGGGYGDREISELFHQKAIDENTPIISTVHDVQIVEKVPVETHDKKINMIVTPKEVIRLFGKPDSIIVQ
jgi:5-formyltetrahydrofolate cyclo-ligase